MSNVQPNVSRDAETRITVICATTLTALNVLGTPRKIPAQSAYSTQMMTVASVSETQATPMMRANMHASLIAIFRARLVRMQLTYNATHALMVISSRMPVRFV